MNTETTMSNRITIEDAGGSYARDFFIMNGISTGRERFDSDLRLAFYAGAAYAFNVSKQIAERCAADNELAKRA